MKLEVINCDGPVLGGWNDTKTNRRVDVRSTHWRSWDHSSFVDLHVVCRAITSNGELARDIEIQLLATSDYQVLATGKTNAAGEYAFKAPDRGYHIVATGDKAHVTNMASVDIR